MIKSIALSADQVKKLCLEFFSLSLYSLAPDLVSFCFTICIYLLSFSFCLHVVLPISFSCLSVSSCIILSFLKMTIFEFVVMQIIALHFFRICYRCFISLLWWCHVCLILHDSHKPCTVFCASQGAKTSVFTD